MWYILSHNKFFSVAIICMALAVITVSFTSYTISNWSSEIRSIRSTSARNELLIKNFEKQLSLYRGGFTEKAERLFHVRPTEERLVSFLNSLDEMAASAGVRNFSLKSIERMPQIKNGSADYATLRYLATFEATPLTLRSFLSNFERLPHFMEVIEFNVTAKEDLSIRDFGDASMTFDIFIRSP